MVNRHSDLSNPDSEVVEGKEPLGTLIELNPKEEITKGNMGMRILGETQDQVHSASK